jgi:hypothetical protein
LRLSGDRPRHFPTRLAAGAAVVGGLLLLVWWDEGFQTDPAKAVRRLEAERGRYSERLVELEQRRLHLQNVYESAHGALESDRRNSHDPDRPSVLNSFDLAVDGWGGVLEPRYESAEHKRRETMKYIRKVEDDIATVLRKAQATDAEIARIRDAGVKRESWTRRLLREVLP